MKKKENIEKYKKERDEYLKGWKRARADFLNYKKEEDQRMEKIAEYEREKIIKELMGVLDDIYLAEKEIPNKDRENTWIKGILGVKKQIEGFFEKMGVEKIDSLGEEFDPALHEAVEMTEDKDKGTGVVVGEVQKGYRIRDKVIRPAKVKVTK